MTIEVVKPGLSSTFQDLGRVGHQHLGVPVGGAMDEIAHRVANLLVGNDEDEAALEITLIGPTLRFQQPASIAICGGDLGATLVKKKGATARPVPCWTPIAVPAGAVLEFGVRRGGCRAVLALRGGFELPLVMGSRSTWVRGGIGGFEGRALKAGDVIARSQRATNAQALIDAEVGRCLWRVLPGGLGLPIRLMPGREWAGFTAASRAALLGRVWRIGVQSDRMAYRMESVEGVEGQGPAGSGAAALVRDDAAELLSEAVAFGTIQVPADGRPIVLMADRQSTGGYPRIAQVASVDLPRLAQRAPGESMRFMLVSHDDAETQLLKRAARLDDLRSALKR